MVVYICNPSTGEMEHEDQKVILLGCIVSSRPTWYTLDPIPIIIIMNILKH